MIVNLIATGWECIYQQAHALLAAQIGQHWQAEKRPVPPARWLETIVAIAQHDDGQDTWTGAQGITGAGAPAPFKLVPFSRAQAERVTAQARFQGRWRWLLTSMHVSFLYEELRGNTPEIDAFLDEQQRGQAACRRGLKLPKKAAQAAYDFVQWCDRLSLILCLNELPDGDRALEISRGPDGRRYFIRRPGVGAGGPPPTASAAVAVVVEPWPFEPDEFTVTTEASYLRQLTFADDAELAAALRAAPIREKVWHFRRRGPA